MNSAKMERIRLEATRLLAAGVSGGVFPGGVACVSWRDADGLAFIEAFAGRVEPNGAPVVANTPYDLASVTKPFVAMTALRLVQSGKLALDSRPEMFIADTRGSKGGQATLEALLSHRSGLAAWGGLYLDVGHEPGTTSARRWIVTEAARRPDESGVSARAALYSDLGYIVAGEMLSRAAGQSLDRVVHGQTLEPLGIADSVFFAGSLSAERRGQLIRRVAPTEFCEWRGRLIRGEVHDENSAALGGVSGHAGLFGSASGVARFGRALLDSFRGNGSFLPQNALLSALAERAGGTQRLGWDAKSITASSAGRRMSGDAFGHLGFTGTSIWCDPARDLVVVLLTNRVHPSRANEKIKGFRPAFHDAVVGLFDAEE